MDSESWLYKDRINKYIGLLPDNFMIYLEQCRKTDPNINIITAFKCGDNLNCFKISTPIPYEVYSINCGSGNGNGNSKYTNVVYKGVFDSLIKKLKYTDGSQRSYSDKLFIIKKLYFECVGEDIKMICEFKELKAIISSDWTFNE